MYAAASLSDVFRELGEAFTAQEGGGPVVFNFAGSQVLSMQIAAGASADVFASADWRSMRALEAGGHVRGVFGGGCPPSLYLGGFGGAREPPRNISQKAGRL